MITMTNGTPRVTPRAPNRPVATFPGAIAGDAQLGIAVNREQTTLAAPMAATDTSMTVANIGGIVIWSLLSIDNEIVQVNNPPAGNVVPVARAFDGTTAGVHLAGATVAGLIDAYHHNTLVAEVEAIEQTLGANLSHVPSASPPVANTAYQFAPQSPGGSLGVGTNMITLNPVPLGVNGSNTNHYLYISGGTGTAEAVPITGGSAVSGAPSGNIFVTCANAHSGAWTVQSATAGIQEAIWSAAPLAAWVKVPPGIYSIYAPITFRLGTTLAGPAACWDGDPTAPSILNYIPLTGSLIVVSVDHCTVRGLFLDGGTAGAATTSIGIDAGGVAPRSAITFQLYDIYSKRFGIGVKLDKLGCVRLTGVAAYSNTSHGFVLGGVQGPCTDLFSQSNGGDGIQLIPASDGWGASPFLLGVHTHNNAGWGINTTVQINLCRFYVNFDKAGEILINTGTGALPGTINDGHVEEAGNSPSYGVNPNAPGIRVAAASTSGIFVSNLQINTNQGSGMELLAGGNSVIGCNITGNGQGGATGSNYSIYAPAGFQRICNNSFGGFSSYGGGIQQILNNSFGVTSANPVLNFTGGTFNMVEGNFINNAGVGTAITAASGVTFYAPFSNAIFGGAVSVPSGSVISWAQYQTTNYIASETGANNAIAGSVPGVPLSNGLRVTVALAHSLGLGANTFNYNSGGALPIVQHTNLTNLNRGYNAGGVIELLYEGGNWLDMSQ